MHAIFVVVWEAQSQLATLAFLVLVAFGSVWLALPVMLGWALAATVVYYRARLRGFPDILEKQQIEACASRSHRARSIACSCIKVWFAGIQAFAFSRVVRTSLSPASGTWRSLLRVGLLGAGLTLFGVATAEHLLRGAGYKGSRLLKLSLLGAGLNVTYRVLLSAAITHAAWAVFRAIQSSAHV